MGYKREYLWFPMIDLYQSSHNDKVTMSSIRLVVLSELVLQ